MVIAENDRTARGVQKGDRLWALFDKDEHGQEWWGGTVIQANLNSRGDGDVDVIFDDGEREVMRAKECFRRCEAGILRSLRQARPNKKAERRLKQCGVVPRENHDIRLPATEARAPTKKKKTTKKAASAAGARPRPAPRPSGPPRRGRAPRRTRGRPSSARGDQGPQARREKPAAAPAAKIRGASSRRKGARRQPRPSLGSRRSPRSSREAEPRPAGRHGVPLLGARRV